MGGKYPQRTLNTAMADAEQRVPSDAALRRPNLCLLAVFDLPENLVQVVSVSRLNSAVGRLH